MNLGANNDMYIIALASVLQKKRIIWKYMCIEFYFKEVDHRSVGV
jgi:hypothetical protein